MHDVNEGYMGDVTFTVASQSAIVGNVISDGSERPKCFYNLDPDSYQVAQQVPAHLQMTSAANTAVRDHCGNNGHRGIWQPCSWGASG